MLTAINIALLGGLLAAVALIIQRRRCGAGDEAVSEGTSETTLAPIIGPAAAIEGDVFPAHLWAEAAATLTPVREDRGDADAEGSLEIITEPGWYLPGELDKNPEARSRSAEERCPRAQVRGPHPDD